VCIITPHFLPGNCGISVDLPLPTSAASPELASFAALYAEELGLVLEVSPDNAALASSLFNQAGVPCSIIGKVLPEQNVELRVGGEAVLSGNTAALRDVWEETSFALERLQAAEECVDQEQSGLKSRTAPKWTLPFTPSFTPADKMSNANKVGLGFGCGAGLLPGKLVLLAAACAADMFWQQF
jgi:phosphoribosylformylglycinamidine synthase